MSHDNLKAAVLTAMEKIRSKPRTAQLVFRAQTQLDEGVRCSAKVRGFAPMVVDEPPALGGGDTAMNPVELVLVALGTCQEIMYAAYASIMGIPLEEVKVDVKGYLDLRGLLGVDESIAPGYERITFNTEIRSPASEDALRMLVETVEQRCPVLDILKRAQEVSGTATVNGTPINLARVVSRSS